MLVSVQRKRGNIGAVFRRKRYVNARGVEKWRPDFDKPPQLSRMHLHTLRTARSEVPGQQTTNQSWISIDNSVEDIGPHTIIWLRGQWWDVQAPGVRHGSLTRRLAHWSFLVKRRPPSIPPGEGWNEQDARVEMDFKAMFEATFKGT